MTAKTRSNLIFSQRQENMTEIDGKKEKRQTTTIGKTKHLICSGGGKGTKEMEKEKSDRQLAAPSSYPEQLASFACFHGQLLFLCVPPPSTCGVSSFFFLLQGTPDSSKLAVCLFNRSFRILLLAFVLFGPFSIFFFERVF
jgi:hypothetical protein